MAFEKETGDSGIVFHFFFFAFYTFVSFIFG